MHKSLLLIMFLISLNVFAGALEELTHEATEKYVVEDTTYYKLKSGNWVYIDKEGKIQTKSDPTLHPKGKEYYKVDGKYLFRIQSIPRKASKCFFKDKEFNCDGSTCKDKEGVCTRVSMKFENGIESVKELYDLKESNQSETMADAPFKPDPKNVLIRFEGEILPGPEDAVEYSQMWDMGIELLHRRGKRYYKSNKKLQNFLKKLDKCIVKKGKDCEYIVHDNLSLAQLYDQKVQDEMLRLIRNADKFLTHNFNHGVGLVDKFDFTLLKQQQDQYNCILNPNEHEWTIRCHPNNQMYLRYGKPYKESANPI